MQTCICIYVYIYIYTCIYIHICANNRSERFVMVHFTTNDRDKPHTFMITSSYEGSFRGFIIRVRATTTAT